VTVEGYRNKNTIQKESPWVNCLRGETLSPPEPPIGCLTHDLLDTIQWRLSFRGTVCYREHRMSALDGVIQMEDGACC